MISNMEESSIFSLAKSRWLNVTELESLLSAETTPLYLSSSPPQSPPPTGVLLLYDRSVTRNYKDDGYSWIKKRNASKVREDHVKLRVNGKYRVAGSYVHSATCTTFHRRAYHLLDPETGSAAVSCKFKPKGGDFHSTASALFNDNSLPMKARTGQSLVLLHYLDTNIAKSVAERQSAGKLKGEPLVPLRVNMDSFYTRPSSVGKRRSLSPTPSFFSNPAARQRHVAAMAAVAAATEQQQQMAFATMAAAQVAAQAKFIEEHMQQQQQKVAEVNNAMAQSNVVQQLCNPNFAAVVSAGISMPASAGAGMHVQNEKPLNNNNQMYLQNSQVAIPAENVQADDFTSISQEQDDETLDILWNMVMEDGNNGNESDSGKVDLQTDVDIQKEAAAAIQQHLTADMEEHLVSTMEQHTGPTNQLEPDLEDQLINSIESSLSTGTRVNSFHGTRKMTDEVRKRDRTPTKIRHQTAEQQRHERQRQERQRQELERQSQERDRQRMEHDQREKKLQEQHRHEQHHQEQVRLQEKRIQQQDGQLQELQRQQQQHQTQILEMRHDLINKWNNDSRASDISIKSAPNSSNEYDRKMLQNRNSSIEDSLSVITKSKPTAFEPNIKKLPEILDFTPDYIVLQEHEILQRTPRVVVSLSSPLPTEFEDFEEGSDGCVWRKLAAFVETAGDTSSSSFDDNSNRLVPKRVVLSPLTTITPHSFKCDMPLKNITSSESRFIIIISLRNYPGIDYLCDGVCVAVTSFLQKKFTAAIGRMEMEAIQSNTGQTSNLEGKTPSFLVSASDGEGNFCLLSQLSSKKFEFEVKIGLPKSVISQGKVASACKNKYNIVKGADNFSISEDTVFPAPAPATVNIASALRDFPNPPERVMIDAAIASPRQDTVHHVGSLESCATPVSSAEKGRLKKRRSSLINGYKSIIHSQEASNAESVNEWTKNIANQSSTDDNFDEMIDRHCKIRFVERISNVMNDTDCTKAVEDKCALSNKINGLHGTDGFVFPDDERLKSMTHYELDSFLDKLLINFVETLVQTNASKNLQNDINSPGASGFTLLHYASLYDLEGLIPVLFTRGAKTSTLTLKGKLTPLHLACGAGNENVAKLLVDNGSSITVRDSFGQTPADHATRNGFLKLASWLRDQKCNNKNLQENEDIIQTKNDAVVIDFELDDKLNNKNLMKEAFNHLNLKDKLAFNMLVKKNTKLLGKASLTKNKGSVSKTVILNDQLEAEALKVHEREYNGTDQKASLEQFQVQNESIPNCIFQNEHDNDLISCISDNDRESLNVAMSLMNEEELADLEQSVDLSDMKKWLLERSYESLKDAYIKTRRNLQTLSEKGPSFGSPLSNNVTEDMPSPHSDRSALLSNQRNLSQAFASLVMRKNLLKQQRQASTEISPTKVDHEIEYKSV